jgi:iron complex outermembrane recepter protein
VSTFDINAFHASSRICARSLQLATAKRRWLSGSAHAFGLVVLLCGAAGKPALAQSAAQDVSKPSVLNPVVVSPGKPKGATRAGTGPAGATRRVNRTAARTAAKPVLQPAANPAALPVANPVTQPVLYDATVAPTPLNGNLVPTIASRVGLTAHELPASVDIVTQQQLREQGYRTTTESAQGAVGVLAGDLGGAPASFSMRGFTSSGEAVNILYNGIWIGPGDITSRVMETANLQQIEFLKGPSSIMTGLDAIGGSVNFVSNQPIPGPIRSELDGSIDSLGTYRTHFGSGGSTTLPGLDYRFDISSSKINSFVDGDYQQLNNVSGQLNYRVSDSFKVFGAVDYHRDDGHAYWGTPLTTTAFSGPFSTSGVVAGSAVNTFTGALMGPVTIDSRTTTTNYNIADNSTGAQELWLRGGFEWALNNDITVKDQVYYYNAQRHWTDSETYAFDPDFSNIARDRFFVTHNQQVVGNNIDLSWNSSFYGMENRFATQLQMSRNDIKFGEEGNFDTTYPNDTVPVVFSGPVGTYGPMSPDVRNNELDTVALSAEDSLKVTPWLTLVGGVRVDDFSLSRSGINYDGTIPDGLPFTQNWNPVSYRAAATFEPVKGMMFYGMYATAYDPAAAGIFSVTPGTTLQLTSARLYETGLKLISDDKRAEATFAVYDINQKNVYVQVTDTLSSLAGSQHTQGVELAGAVHPVDNVKIWGNVALTDSTYGDFGAFTGNTPANVAPVIINAGASYRFDNLRWPVEVGGSVRHVGARYLYQDDLTVMLPYTTADLYAFVDIPGRDLSWQGLETMRVMFRVRNLTNALYAQFSDGGLPDQVILGAPRTFELSASAKW